MFGQPQLNRMARRYYAQEWKHGREAEMWIGWASRLGVFGRRDRLLLKHNTWSFMRIYDALTVRCSIASTAAIGVVEITCRIRWGTSTKRLRAVTGLLHSANGNRSARPSIQGSEATYGGDQAVGVLYLSSQASLPVLAGRRFDVLVPGRVYVPVYCSLSLSLLAAARREALGRVLHSNGGPVTTLKIR